MQGSDFGVRSSDAVGGAPVGESASGRKRSGLARLSSESKSHSPTLCLGCGLRDAAVARRSLSRGGWWVVRWPAMGQRGRSEEIATRAIWAFRSQPVSSVAGMRRVRKKKRKEKPPQLEGNAEGALWKGSRHVSRGTSGGENLLRKGGSRWEMRKRVDKTRRKAGWRWMAVTASGPLASALPTRGSHDRLAPLYQYRWSRRGRPRCAARLCGGGMYPAPRGTRGYGGAV